MFKAKRASTALGLVVILAKSIGVNKIAAPVVNPVPPSIKDPTATAPTACPKACASLPRIIIEPIIDSGSLAASAIAVKSCLVVL